MQSMIKSFMAGSQLERDLQWVRAGGRHIRKSEKEFNASSHAYGVWSVKILLWKNEGDEQAERKSWCRHTSDHGAC